MQKQVLRTLNFFYYAAMVLAVAMAALGFWLVSQKGITIDPLEQTGIVLSYIVIFYIIVSVPVSLWRHNRQVKKLKGQTDETAKLGKYKQYGIVRIVLTGIGLAAAVLLFYLIQQNSMIFCAGIAAVGLYFCKPTETKLLTDLDDNMPD